jgi:hypothetical protein
MLSRHSRERRSGFGSSALPKIPGEDKKMEQLTMSAPGEADKQLLNSSPGFDPLRTCGQKR